MRVTNPHLPEKPDDSFFRNVAQDTVDLDRAEVTATLRALFDPVEPVCVRTARIAAHPENAAQDYTLGWTDGFAVFQRIRTAYPQCLVIVFTGVGDETLAVELLKAGVDDYVVKHGRRRLGEAAQEAIGRAAERQRETTSDA